MEKEASVIGSSNDAPHSEDKTSPVAGPEAYGSLCGECGGKIGSRQKLIVHKVCYLCKGKKGCILLVSITRSK